MTDELAKCVPVCRNCHFLWEKAAKNGAAAHKADAAFMVTYIREQWPFAFSHNPGGIKRF
jgi:hypothetical protein